MQRFLLAFSAALAIGYGFYGYRMYGGPAPYVFPAAFKASSIVILALIAWTVGGPSAGADGTGLERAAPAAHAARDAALHPSDAGAKMPAGAPAIHSELLATGLLFGALGDALLAWSHEAFLFGALAFLVGHLCYIALFVRSGIGMRAAVRDRTRLLLLLATVLAALAASQMTPHDSPMFAPLAVYSGVLTLMVLSSYTLPRTRWLAMAGAVLFFISDGFVAWNMFHHDPDPMLAFWRSFAGWMIYWAGQAGICVGALGLHKRAASL